ncbi:MAG: DUF5684 domain-containing protein [Chthoniobacterales bacterium]
MIKRFSALLLPVLVATPLLAQDTDSTSTTTINPIFWIIYFVIIVLMIAALWKVFTKAGQPGWGVLIPIYNLYLMCKIAGRPGWWLLLTLIPFVNLIIFIILYVDIAQRFGKGVGFAIGLLFLPFIFFPILGFGSAQYEAEPVPTTMV